ncbi:hypothetical protein WSM22_30960 [Cytophagales bacterium WSM2-2]|nr:hypothetical protein WSM22_30960 [Cytophagales bacterium WSM2-2]
MKWLLFVTFCLIAGIAEGQNHRKAYNQNRYYNPRVRSSIYEEGMGSFGMGIGLDYGGVGGRFMFIPEPHIGLFAGGGFALAGFGYNFGGMLRLMPQKKFTPTIAGMFGTNAAIFATGTATTTGAGGTTVTQPGLSKMYFGPSISVGLIVRSLKYQGRYLHFQVAMPFRTSDYQTDLDASKAAGFKPYYLPGAVVASIGYHFGIE